MAAIKALSIEENKAKFRAEIEKRMKSNPLLVQERLNVFKGEILPDDLGPIVMAYMGPDRSKELSYSSLKKFRTSPLDFVQYILDKQDPEKNVQTDAMLEGKVLDSILTTPHLFDDQFYVMEEKIERRSNEGKAIWELYLELADKKSLVSLEMFESCCKMAESIRKNEDAAYYVSQMHKSQVPIRFKHYESGLWLHGFEDWESNPESADFFVCDLKKNRSAKRDDFIKDAARMDYHLQSGIYTMYHKVKRYAFPDFIHVVVEPTEPYGVNVFRAAAGGKYLNAAHEEVHNTLMAFKYCLDNNLWHKSYDFVRHEALRYDEMEMPGYYKEKFV